MNKSLQTLIHEIYKGLNYPQQELLLGGSISLNACGITDRIPKDLDLVIAKNFDLIRLRAIKFANKKIKWTFDPKQSHSDIPFTESLMPEEFRSKFCLIHENGTCVDFFYKEHQTYTTLPLNIGNIKLKVAHPKYAILAKIAYINNAKSSIEEFDNILNTEEKQTDVFGEIIVSDLKAKKTIVKAYMNKHLDDVLLYTTKMIKK